MFLKAATNGLVISLANPHNGNNNPTRENGIRYCLEIICGSLDNDLPMMI